MLYIRKLIALAFIVLLFSDTGTVYAQQIGNCNSPLSEAYLDVNNVRARLFNNGNLFWRGSPYVYEIPKGGGVSAIFNSGIWIGGLVGGQLRAAAARYFRYQFWAGPLDDDGNPPDDCSVFDHLYKVSLSDVDDYEASGVAAPDLRDWPTGLGAPTWAAPGNGLDDDGDGEIDENEGELINLIAQPLATRVDRVINLAGGERPAILGDQSIWWIMNDRGNDHVAPGADTPPIGIEVHAMAFAFNSAGPIGDATFYKYDIYYKGTEPLTDAYLAVYSDPDLGNFDDDWVGADTVRGMGFVWNADDEDEGGFGYGTPPPAAGYDFFQGPIVPSIGDTAKVSEARIPDFRNLEMAHFVYYNNGGCVSCDPQNGQDYYNFMRGRWRDGVRFTEGGAGRDFSQTPVDVMFPGDVGESDAECQYWSECNSDDLGTDIAAADRRFAMSTGPFVINPGDFQQIVFGIVFARGTSNFNSVTRMKAADELAQAAYNIDFKVPSPPAPVDLIATPADQAVILEWTNGPRSNNFLESYAANDPFISEDMDNDFLFEGYDVIQYDDPLDAIGRVIATYDVPNDITRVIDGPAGEPTTVTATGSDSGISNTHTVTGLTNYTTYHFGVQPYAYNAISSPKVYRGPVERISVIPTIPTREISDQAVAAQGGGNAPDFVAVGDPAIGGGVVQARVVNPITMRNGIYTVDFYTHTFAKSSGSAPFNEGDVIDPLDPMFNRKTQETTATTYNISRDDVILFNGRDLDRPAPQRPSVFFAEGLVFDITGPLPGFIDFQVTTNADGRISDNWPIPYTFAGWPWADFPCVEVCGFFQRGVAQVSGARWGFHAGGADQQYGPVTDGGSFLGRSTREGFLYPNMGPYDYEYRFTQECLDQIDDNIDPVNDCLGIRWYGDEELMEVPFTIWRSGVGTPWDYSDDVQLVPYVCDTDTCGAGSVHGVYDIGGDHPASVLDDDPSTDWVYFNLPVDDSPGSAGYLDFMQGNNRSLVTQIHARSVLVQWNGGTAPPYDVEMIEPGSTYRAVTSKPHQPGDRFYIDTDGYGATNPEGSRAEARLEDIGIVPNPYKGASAYEVSQLTNEVRFTNLPDVATIRIFTLNGTLIKTLEKNSPGSATLSWDMVTEYNLPIASGIYLVHVTVPDVGETTIKFAVVKKRIQLNTY